MKAWDGSGGSWGSSWRHLEAVSTHEQIWHHVGFHVHWKMIQWGEKAFQKTLQKKVPRHSQIAFYSQVQLDLARSGWIWPDLAGDVRRGKVR